MEKKKKYPPSQARYNKEYTKKNIKIYTILLNRNTNADIIEYLDSKEHRQEYFKNLIREDIKKG